MRVSVVNWTGGGLSGGYRKYLRNVMPLVANDSRVTELCIFVPYGNEDLLLDSNMSVIPIPSFPMLHTVSWLKKEISAWKPDVVFIPTARRFSCRNIPVVTMVQNMEPLVVPFTGNPMREKLKNIGRIAVARQACNRAERVIAVSNYVKYHLVEKWKIKEQKIGVVYHGVSHNYCVGGNSERAFVSMPAPFLFTAGSIRPARGLEDIIKALSILHTDPPIQLAVGGDVDPGMGPYFIRLKKMAANSGLTERIHWLGKLNDSEMAWCYSHCEAFIMTSRVEACPNIALEAMSHGCLSIASDNPPLPEFFADSALYYPPNDFTALAKQSQAVISMGQAERAAMSSTAKDIASRFSWETCAQMTVNELQRILQ